MKPNPNTTHNMYMRVYVRNISQTQLTTSTCMCMYEIYPKHNSQHVHACVCMKYIPEHNSQHVHACVCMKYIPNTTHNMYMHVYV